MTSRLTRRRFMGWVGAGAAACTWPGQARADGGERPNVLFMAVDDLNDWVHCMGGHPDTKSPNLDRLAARGTLFANAHCAAPLCNASRAALMTGIRPATSGVYFNDQPWRPAMPDAVTLPQHFMAHGYQAEGGGKIYHGSYPDPPSWQNYFPDQQNNKPGDPMPNGRPLNGIPNTAHFDWGPVDAADEEMGDWQVAQWAEGQLKRKHDKPFFLGVGFFRPHLPWYVPKKYFDLFPHEKVTLPKVKKDDLEDVPEVGRKIARPDGDHRKVLETNNWSKAVASYLASIAFMDVCVGKVLDALDAGPNAKNTIIVLWGDHGWHLGEKLHWRKFTLWEEATRCPFMMVVPGMTQPGGVCNRSVTLLDIYPTLVEICGLKANPALEGVSVAPLLKDPAADWNRPALTTYGQNNHSLRTERWRYIRYHDGSEELYDHGDDEMEWKNLAGDPKHDALKKELQPWLPKVNKDPAPKEKKGKGKGKGKGEE